MALPGPVPGSIRPAVAKRHRTIGVAAKDGRGGALVVGGP